MTDQLLASGGSADTAVPCRNDIRAPRVSASGNRLLLLLLLPTPALPPLLPPLLLPPLCVELPGMLPALAPVNAVSPLSGAASMDLMGIAAAAVVVR
jgi:hypothetical protein